MSKRIKEIRNANININIVVSIFSELKLGKLFIYTVKNIRKRIKGIFLLIYILFIFLTHTFLK